MSAALGISTILSDNGREFCGRLDQHPYELFLQLEEIDHTKTRTKRPQTNGICERFHRTVQEGVQGTHHGGGQDDVPHAGEPDDQHLRRRFHLLRLGHGRKVTPSKQEAAPFRGRLPPQAIW